MDRVSGDEVSMKGPQHSCSTHDIQVLTMREASGSLPWGKMVESPSSLDPLFVGGTGENNPLHGLGSFQDLEVCRVWEAVGGFFRRYSS